MPLIISVNQPLIVSFSVLITVGFLSIVFADENQTPKVQMVIKYPITYDYGDHPIKKQLEIGVLPEDVICPQHIPIRIMKLSDNSFACVKLETSKVLVERGWGTRLVSPICADENGKVKDHLVILTDKKNYTLGETIIVVVKNCSDKPYWFPSTNRGILIEATDGTIRGSPCVGGEAISDIPPNAKLSWEFSLVTCHGDPLPVGEYFVYNWNTDNKGLYSINIIEKTP